MGEWIFENPDAVARVAASRLVQTVKAAVARRGVCHVALSGGNSPLAVYHALKNPALMADIPWASLHLFWGDERCVPLGDHRSNAGEALRAMGMPQGLPVDHLHPIKGKLGRERAASDYERELAKVFGNEPGRPPVFDLVVLGLGPDGHTASLFPGDAALAEKNRWVVGVSPPLGADPPVDRVSLTLPVFNAARNVLFMATGRAKRQALNSVRRGDPSCPAALVRPCREPVWIIDEALAMLEDCD